MQTDGWADINCIIFSHFVHLHKEHMQEHILLTSEYHNGMYSNSRKI